MGVRVLAILVLLALYPLVSTAGEPTQVVVHNTSGAPIVVAVAYYTSRGWSSSHSGTGIMMEDHPDHSIKGFWRIAPGKKVTVLDGGPRDELIGFLIRIQTTEGEWNPSDRASCVLLPSHLGRGSSGDYFVQTSKVAHSKGCKLFVDELGHAKLDVESYVAQHLLKGESLRFVWTGFKGYGRKVYRVY